MILYLPVFLICVAALLGLLVRRKKDLIAMVRENSATHLPTFASFMRMLQQEIIAVWRLSLRDRLLLFIEKRLRWIRIFILRAERFLFRVTHRIRGISERNHLKNTTDEASSQDTPSNSSLP